MRLGKGERRSPSKGHRQLLRRQSSVKRRPLVRRTGRRSTLMSERMLENASAGAQDSQKTLCNKEEAKIVSNSSVTDKTGSQGSQISQSNYKPPSCADEPEDISSKHLLGRRPSRRILMRNPAHNGSSSIDLCEETSSAIPKHDAGLPRPSGPDFFDFKTEELQEVDFEAAVQECKEEFQQTTESEETLREPHNFDQKGQEMRVRPYRNCAKEESRRGSSENMEDFPLRPMGEHKCEQEVLPSPRSSSTIAESKPPRRTLAQHVKRRAHQVWKLIKNPKADLHHPYLPKGLDLRIRERDPLEDQWRRRKNPKPHAQSHPKRLPHKVQAPELRFRYRLTEDGERIPVKNLPPPAPERVAPAILPHKNFEPNPGFDRFYNPIGGEVSLFHETTGQRAARVNWDDKYRNWRAASDIVMRFRPIPHLNNPSVGRAPPLPLPTLVKMAKRANSRAGKSLQKQKEMLQIKSRTQSIDKELGLPTPDARPHEWDNWMLRSKKSVSFSRDGLENQREGQDQRQTGVLQNVLEVPEPTTPIPTASPHPSLHYSVSRSVSGEHLKWFPQTSQEVQNSRLASLVQSHNSENSPFVVVLDFPPRAPPKDSSPRGSMHSLQSFVQLQNQKLLPALSTSSRFSQLLSDPPPDRLLPPLPTISDTPQVQDVPHLEKLHPSPALLGKSIFLKLELESCNSSLERPLPPLPVSRLFSFIPGQDDIGQVIEAGRSYLDESLETQSRPEITESSPIEQIDDEVYYSDSDYDEDEQSSQDIQDQFGTLVRIRAAIPDHSSWRPPSTWGQTAENSEMQKDTEVASRSLSTANKNSSIYWANLYSTPGNPFENAHPQREQQWKEAELTLLGKGPKPTLASAIPPEEIIAAILGIAGDGQDQDINPSPTKNSDGNDYFPHYAEVFNVHAESVPVLLKNDSNGRFTDSNNGECLDSTDQRGIPRSETENSDLSDAHSAKFLRFYSSDGTVQNEMLVDVKDEPLVLATPRYVMETNSNLRFSDLLDRNNYPLATRISSRTASAANVDKVQREIRRNNEQAALFQRDLTGCFAQRNKPSEERGSPHPPKRYLNERVQKATKITLTDAATQWSPSRERAATDAPTPSRIMIMETEEATGLVVNSTSCPVAKPEVHVGSPISNRQRPEGSGTATLDVIEGRFRGINNKPENSNDTSTPEQLYNMNGDRVLGHEARLNVTAAGMDPSGGDASDDGAFTVLQSTPIDQQTPKKGPIQAINTMSPRPISAPALLPSLEEHVEHVERRLGYWGGLFEDAVHPEVYNSCYCGFLVNPERVHKCQTAMNVRLEALKSGALPPYITDGDGKLVISPRPQLPSRYLTRPKMRLSPTAGGSTSTNNNKFVPTLRNTGTEQEDNKEDKVSPLLMKYWRVVAMTMGSSHDVQSSSQNASHTVEPNYSSIQSSTGGQGQDSDAVIMDTQAQRQTGQSLSTSQNQASMDSQTRSADSELEDMMERTLDLHSHLEAAAARPASLGQFPIGQSTRPASNSQSQASPETAASTPQEIPGEAAQTPDLQETSVLAAQAIPDSLEQQHPFDRSLPTGSVPGTEGGHQRSNAIYASQAVGGSIFNPHRVSYQRGDVNVPTHGNLTSRDSGHLPRRGSGSGRTFPGGTGAQPLVLPDRVSRGVSVADPNDDRVLLSVHPQPVERMMRYEGIRSATTRVPRSFPPGTAIQPLVLADGLDEQQSVSERDDQSEEQRGERSGRREGSGGSVVAARSEPHGDGDAHRPAGAPTTAKAAAANLNLNPLHERGGGSAASDISQTQTHTPAQIQAPLHTQPPSINVTTASPRSPISAESSLFPPRRSSLHAPLAADQDRESFLVQRLASEDTPLIADMDKLQVRSSEFSTVKSKAIEDARQMQARVIEECTRTGKDPPPYGLVELIGKGSFGRVYMGKDMKSAAIVAVKIIDIDESDTLNPRIADSYSEFLKEVNALKILSENKAKNINHVIEALPVNQAMWMITEYCGGGSVATLMKPSAPAGLMEKWIIPILREVAEALKWVHQAGIIHRDIKCANVLITEQGGVQLCDFGVAGIIENKLDKRSTIIGTPHWMAPELFNDTPSYGKEVDIWAFGAMTYEIATGYPPNVANGIPYERLGSHLKKNVPRLEGGDYSNELRDMVAFLLEEVPSARPTIEHVQKHKYIANTSSTYPTTNLRSLVGSFRVWESRGGDRKSLFMQHGAQGPSNSPSGQDEWNFSTTEVFDKKVMEEFSAQDVFDAYGPSINFDEATARPNQRQASKGSRRRPPPEALARMPAPLEKIFDPNTMSNYEENSRVHYGKIMTSGPSTSDLPLRDDSAQTSIKDTMIDLGGHDSETGLSSFPDMDTIKAGRRQDENEDQYNSTLHDFSRPALSDPADINTNRRTQDWKFPSMAPPASADPELSRFPTAIYELPRPAVTPGSSGRPALVHHPTEPIGAFGGGLLGPTQPAMDRLSMRESLIDLDMSLPDTIPEIRRPSTANSDISTTSEQTTSGNPFELEHHASQLYQQVTEQGSDPAIYVSEDPSVPTRLQNGNPLQDIADMSDFSASDVEGPQANGRARRLLQYDGADDPDYHAMPPPPLPKQPGSQPSSDQPYTMAHFPPLPEHPSVAALTGTASMAEMQDEIKRALSGLSGQLSAFKDVYSAAEVVTKRGSGLVRKEATQE